VSSKRWKGKRIEAEFENARGEIMTGRKKLEAKARECKGERVVCDCLPGEGDYIQVCYMGGEWGRGRGQRWSCGDDDKEKG